MTSAHAQLDKDGFLRDIRAWDTSLAGELAEICHIELTDAHWEVVTALREFYATTEVAPSMRPFVKLVRDRLGTDKGNSIYLMQLFGSSPAKTAARIAGLPKPTNCL